MRQGLPGSITAGMVRIRLSLPFMVLGLFSLVVLARPLMWYDNWMYHLPFSSRLWNIGGGEGSFHLSSQMAPRWDGFPKLWEWVQGLFWATTGTINSIIIPQLLLCVAYFVQASRECRANPGWVLLAFFASPMLLIHFQTPYFDLPPGICIALGFMFLMRLLQAPQSVGGRFPWIVALAGVASLAAAGNMKFQGLLGSLCVLGIVAVLALFAGELKFVRRMAILGVLIGAGLLASLSAISNAVAYGNPFYPFSVTVHGRTVFPGPEDPSADAKSPRYPLVGNREVEFPGPVNFVLSATELDWTLRGVAPWYTVDSNHADSPRRGPPSRTGGWGGLFVAVNIWLLAMQILRWSRETDPHQRRLVLAASLLVVATALMPRSHELRYWLYLPLVLLPVNLRYASLRFDPRMVSGVLAFMMVYSAIFTFISPNSGLITRGSVSRTAMRSAVPPEVVRALRESGRYCGEPSGLLFRYSRAVTGLQGLVSEVPAECGPSITAGSVLERAE